MKHRTQFCKISLILAVLAFFNSAFSDKSGNSPLYFAGVDFLYTRIRTGSYSFESIETRQEIPKPNLKLWGFSIGKRYYAVSWFRFQINGMFHFGDIVEDTSFDFSSLQYFSSKYLFKHVGCDLDIHLVRPKHKKLDLFVLLGGGINYMHMEEQTVLPENHEQEVTLSNYNGINLKYWCPSLHLGAGFDIKFIKECGISTTYSYRIWQPVKYLDARDLPLQAIEYKEIFYTHMIQMKFHFNLISE